jgi:hypothetical protein
MQTYPFGHVDSVTGMVFLENPSNWCRDTAKNVLYSGLYLSILHPWAQENFAPSPLFVRIQLCVSKNNTKNRQKAKHYSVFSTDLP